MHNFADKLLEIIKLTRARHVEVSLIASADDNPGKPNDRLLDISSEAIRLCREVMLDVFRARQSPEAKWFEVWPGEHYKLLAALVRLLRPKIVVEVGTSTGMGTLALSQEIRDGKVHTFDIMPWHEFGETWLTEADFKRGIVQHIADLSAPEHLHAYRELLESADLIFVDGPKNGVFEPEFINLFSGLRTKKEILVIFDDIRLLNMIPTWRHIRRPKIDLTSFGHWSGTGLVDWNG